MKTGRGKKNIPHKNRENVSEMEIMIQFFNHSFTVLICEQDVTTGSGGDQEPKWLSK